MRRKFILRSKVYEKRKNTDRNNSDDSIFRCDNLSGYTDVQNTGAGSIRYAFSAFRAYFCYVGSSLPVAGVIGYLIFDIANGYMQAIPK